MIDAKETTKAIKDVLKKHKAQRDSLIPLLQDIQQKLGFISEEAVEAAANALKMSQSDIYGVATFYTQFRFSRPGDHIVRVCEGTACHVRGGKRIMDEVSKYLHIKPQQTTPDYKYSLESVACFGSCALSPVVVVDDDVNGRMTPREVKRLLKDIG